MEESQILWTWRNAFSLFIPFKFFLLTWDLKLDPVWFKLDPVRPQTQSDLGGMQSNSGPSPVKEIL